MNGSPIKRQDEVKNTLPIGRIEGSKTVEAHAPLIRYFINGIGPKRTLLSLFWFAGFTRYDASVLVLKAETA